MKNKMMRAASVLMVAVLLSTCAISGTFAKYVTSDSAQDTARVAKWGVSVMASGNLFGQNYNKATGAVDANEKNNEISVSAQQSVDATTNIVAPGTKNTTGMTFEVKGTPEVANKITVESNTLTESEIWLKAGKYGVLVEASGVTTDNVQDYYELSGGSYKKATAGTYDNAKTYYELHDPVTVTATANEKYYPIVWTIANEVNTGLGSDTTVAGTKNTLAEVVSAISTAFATTGAQNDANLDIDETVTLTWAWAMTGQQDGADTILGNLQDTPANMIVVKTSDDTTYTTLTDGIDYELDLAFDITITVEQVD